MNLFVHNLLAGIIFLKHKKMSKVYISASKKICADPSMIAFKLAKHPDIEVVGMSWDPQIFANDDSQSKICNLIKNECDALLIHTGAFPIDRAAGIEHGLAVAFDVPVILFRFEDPCHYTPCVRTIEELVQKIREIKKK